MSDFNFGVDIDIDKEQFEKAKKGSRSDKYDNMIIWGRASDAAKDQEGQNLYPSGYEFEDFLKKGLVNLEHYTTRKGSSKYWIGEPIEARVEGEEFFVKAKLWSKSPEAREFYDKVIEMKESGSTRKPGWSIEGQAIEKDPYNPNRILRARINNIAVTMSPVNQNSWVDIVKGTQKQDFIESVIDKQNNPYLFQYELEDGSILTVNRDMSVSINKNRELIKTVDIASMRALMPESIDGKEKKIEKAKFIIDAINKNTIEKDLGKNIIRKILLS